MRWLISTRAAVLIMTFISAALAGLFAWRDGSFAFLPWFALMMIWFFGYTMDWFPIGKFLNPVLWITAPVEANYVFHRMLISATITGILIFVWLLFTRRFRPSTKTPARLLGIAIIFILLILYWASTDVWFYALYLAPSGSTDSYTGGREFCRYDAANPQQYAGNLTRGLHHGSASKRSAQQSDPGQTCFT